MASWPWLSFWRTIAQHGEDVGVDTWHAAGDAWYAESSRIVTVWLKLASASLRQ